MSIEQRVEQKFRPTADRTCTEASGGMVSAAHPGATEAGILMLKKNGNAVDAAVAAALALCVCEPQACSLGGQTYGLLHLNGNPICLDGSGRVPMQQLGSGLKREDILYGHRGTSVPTTPAVLARMHERYGLLPWRQVMEPAIDLAENGYLITRLQSDLQKRELPHFLAPRGKSGARYFLKDGKSPYAVGDRFLQPELAALLKRLAQNGVEEFYLGEPAHRIHEDMRLNSGFLTRDDLATIPWPHEREAIEQEVFGHRLITMPPPTQGRLLLYILKVAGVFADRGIDPLDPEFTGLLADLFCSAYRHRMNDVIHPDLYDFAADPMFFKERLDLETDQLLVAGNDRISLPALTGGETTHLSVMDSSGNCAAITQSVNMVYGSKAAAHGLGFLYNNYLIDSWLLGDSSPHGLVPGNTPPCSVAPFVLMNKNNCPWLIGGSPGSQRIVNTLSLFLLRVLHHGIPIDQAMRQPRFHSQDQGKIHVEMELFPLKNEEALKNRGYRVEKNPPFYFGAVHAVLKTSKPLRFQGVAEHRRDGTAAGVST